MYYVYKCHSLSGTEKMGCLSKNHVPVAYTVVKYSVSLVRLVWLGHLQGKHFVLAGTCKTLNFHILNPQNELSFRAKFST